MGANFEAAEPLPWPASQRDLSKETRPELLARVAACPNPWSILLITPNMERKVAETLTEARLTVYVPIETYRPKPVNVARAYRPWRPRTRPLIPGYLFADLTDEHHLDVARANYAVRRIMCWEGVPVQIAAKEMRKIILDEAEGAFDFSKRASGARPGRRRGRRGAGDVESRWKSGQRVKVADGPFAGFIGTIMKADRMDRIEVLVSIFGRQTPVQLDEDSIEDDGDATPGDEARGGL